MEGEGEMEGEGGRRRKGRRGKGHILVDGGICRVMGGRSRAKYERRVEERKVGRRGGEGGTGNGL